MPAGARIFTGNGASFSAQKTPARPPPTMSIGAGFLSMRSIDSDGGETRQSRRFFVYRRRDQRAASFGQR